MNACMECGRPTQGIRCARCYRAWQGSPAGRAHYSELMRAHYDAPPGTYGVPLETADAPAPEASMFTILDRCPRCNGPVFKDQDPQYGYCINHGTTFLGVPFDHPRSGTRIQREPYTGVVRL